MSHNCQDHINWMQCTSFEPHGERFFDEWLECRVCGERYSVEEMDQIFSEVNNQKETASEYNDSYAPVIEVGFVSSDNQAPLHCGDHWQRLGAPESLHPARSGGLG